MATDAKNLKICRVPTASDDAFMASTPAKGSIYFREKTSQIVVGDGATAGGIPFATASALATEISDRQTADSAYLPLSGGTMTGPLFRDDVLAKNSVTSSTLSILGGTSTEDGGALWLHGKDQSAEPGIFRLRAANGATYIDLIGNPSGTLTWGDKTVEQISSYTDAPKGYIRYESGLQICWGSSVDTATEWTISYPVAFSYAPYPVACSGDWGDGEGYSCTVRSQTETGFNVIQHDGTIAKSGAKRINWIAIGFWK